MADNAKAQAEKERARCVSELTNLMEKLNLSPDSCAGLINSLKTDTPTYITTDPVRKREEFAAGLRSAKKQEVLEA
jgi:hypothetical protein